MPGSLVSFSCLIRQCEYASCTAYTVLRQHHGLTRWGGEVAGGFDPGAR
jgi:hypothetical protein